ncbi:MAG: putative membrane protein SpoIIM required for sporulation [Saprospiraceae bacterium]|jgi:uncharacterized membrane protein SpoIIM required for sporulation
MRETKFIKQNTKKWADFEKTLEKKSENPEELNDLFVQVTDDLSYARTFYPNRSVRVYLNGLGQKIFFSLYKSRKREKGRLKHFVLESLPQIIYESRKEFRISFLVFALSMAIGVLSCYMDEDFVRIILGESYVEMTLENIQNNDPMAVYKAKDEGGMFARIAANNLRVALMTFAMGAVYAIGTILIMIKNGIMVGAFQYFFVEQGLFWDSFLTIWTHGTLEISAIIIAGAAGLTMGRGLVFPGTLSRIKAFQISARRGLKIMVGITPIIILAGFIEGYFTRYTETPDTIRLLFILACLAFILFYFVYFPWIKAKRGFQSDLRHSHLSPDNTQKLNFDNIKSNGAIFSDVFVFAGKYLGQLSKISAGVTVVYLVIAFLLSESSPADTFEFSSFMASAEPGAYQFVMMIAQLFFGSLGVAGQFFSNEQIPLLIAVNTLTMALVGTYVFQLLLTETYPTNIPTERNKKLSWQFLLFSKMLVPSAVIALFLSLNEGYVYFFGIAVLPLLMVWMYIMVFEQKHIFASFGRLFKLIGGSFWRILGLSATLVLLGMLTFMLSDSLVFYFIFDFIGMNLNFEEETMNNLSSILLSGIAMFFLHLIFAILMIGFGMAYHTLVEIKEAPNLLGKIENIGEERRLQGMARES